MTQVYDTVSTAIHSSPIHKKWTNPMGHLTICSFEDWAAGADPAEVDMLPANGHFLDPPRASTVRFHYSPWANNANGTRGSDSSDAHIDDQWTLYDSGTESFSDNSD